MKFRIQTKAWFILIFLLTISLLCAILFFSLHHMLSIYHIFAYVLITVLSGGGMMYYLFHKMMEEIEAREKILLFQSRNDPVTNLPNRISFFEHLTKKLQDSESLAPMAIVTIVVDRFPQINHALGHRIGDRLLHHVAQRLIETLNNAQVLARLSSNVFIALLPNITPNNFLTEAERILALFESPFSVFTVAIDLDVLLGFSFFPNDGIEADTLVQKADVALYGARFSPLRYSVYSSEKDPHHFNKISLMSELREGLTQDEFEVYYQPKVNLDSGNIVQVEALVRWKHPIRGFMTPDQFIPMAEETGNIKKLTFWLIEKSIAQCSLWHKEGVTLDVAINLSVKDLLNEKLPNYINDLLKKYTVDPSWITFEITESAFMNDPENAMIAVKKIKELNVHFSLDDFGTGFSSLKYLKQLPIDELKIDKLFIEEITQSARVAQIVRSTIGLGHSINVKIVAEGLCKKEAYDMLKGFGCDLGQGYLFSKPLPLQELHEWLNTSSWGLPSN